MKVAFDIHGTLDDDDDGLLMGMFRAALVSGEDVYIISGPPKVELEKELKELGIDPDKVTIISVVDWLKSKGVPMWQDEKKTWWCQDSEWWTSKGKICEEYKINMIFDDCAGYHASMPETTKFIHWTGYSRRDK